MLEKKKLAIVYFGSSEGGSGLALEWAKHLEKHFEVIVCLSHKNPMVGHFKKLGIEYRVFNTYDRNLTSLIYTSFFTFRIQKIADSLRKENLENYFDVMPSYWQSRIKKRLPGSRWFLVVHDVEPHPDRWRLATVILRIIFPSKSDVNVVLSKYSYRKLKKRNKTLPCILTEHPKYKGYQSETDIDYIKKRFVENRNKFLFFGRIERYKGIEVLIEAFRLAKKENKNIVLTIAGKGPINKKYARIVKEENIHFINTWISDEKMKVLFDTHGCLVLPYLSATQSGPAAIALSRCMPCIGTDVGALPEQILDGVNGDIIPSNDIIKLKEKILNYSWNALTVEKYVDNSYKLLFGGRSNNNQITALAENIMREIK